MMNAAYARAKRLLARLEKILCPSASPNTTPKKVIAWIMDKFSVQRVAIKRSVAMNKHTINSSTESVSHQRAVSMIRPKHPYVSLPANVTI